MYKQLFIVLTLSVTLVLSAVASVHAQQSTQQQPGTTTDQQTQPGTTTNNDDNTLADWWWVLPLLAIPVIYLMTRKKDNRSGYRDDRYAGAKGGESRRDRDDDDL